MTRKSKAKETSTQPQTVAEAEAVLQSLEGKRLELQEKAEQLAAERKDAAFSAHTGIGDHKLASVTRAIRECDADLSTLGEAIHVAANHVLVAKGHEADLANKRNATRILELTGKLREAGEKMDAACKTLGETGKELSGLFLELRGMGVSHPTLEMWLVHGGICLATAVSGTPWAKNYRPVPPLERKQFGPLISNWATGIESRVRVPKREEIAA